MPFTLRTADINYAVCQILTSKMACVPLKTGAEGSQGPTALAEALPGCPAAAVQGHGMGSAVCTQHMLLDSCLVHHLPTAVRHALRRSSAWVCFDGKQRQELLCGDSVRVRMSPNPVPTIDHLEQTSDWFDSLEVGRLIVHPLLH